MGLRLTDNVFLRDHHHRSKEWTCKNFIAVLEHPKDLRNVVAFVRNALALGVEKIFIITSHPDTPALLEDMRSRHVWVPPSLSALRWSFLRVFPTTEDCIQLLRSSRYTSVAFSPKSHGKDSHYLDNADFTTFKKLAIWFGNESSGLSFLALSESRFCVQLPLAGLIEDMSLGVCSGVVLYEAARQRREYVNALAEKRQWKKWISQMQSEITHSSLHNS